MPKGLVGLRNNYAISGGGEASEVRFFIYHSLLFYLIAL